MASAGTLEPVKRLLTLLLCLPILASAQLRIATWNISNYGGGRVGPIQTVVFSSFEGRSLQPDVLVCQEILSASGQAALLAALNSAPGSSGTWAAAPFTDGNDTDNAFFYRSDRIALLASTIIATGANPPAQPRDTKRYDVRLLGYGVLTPKIAIYSSHMKAGTAVDDEARRLTEALAIRTNAQSLSGFDGFTVVGDFNTYTSSDDAFVKLTGSEANNAGRFFDPITTPGSWDGNSSFRFVHSQDPATSSGMNSRFDFVLLCESLRDGQGFDYLGNPNAPYSTITWNDPAHSYRAWGNDGTSFGNPLTVTGNAMVGATIAQAIKDSATAAGGHVPVFLDLRVPAELSASPTVLDFGTVVVGSSASRSLSVSNSTSSTTWRTGIADLVYQLSAPAGFGAPGGQFVDPAGGAGNAHSITMSTTTPGPKSGTLQVGSSVPGTNSAGISLVGQVVPDDFPMTGFTLLRGIVLGGSLASTVDSDDVWLSIRGRFENDKSNFRFVQAEFSAVSPVPSVTSLTLRIETSLSSIAVETLEAFDFVAGLFVQVNQRVLGTTEVPLQVTLTAPARFLEPGTRRMLMRTALTQHTFTPGTLAVYKVDRLAWMLR